MKTVTLSVFYLAVLASSAGAAARSPGAALDKADANHDGYVTREEFKASRAAQFVRLDRNGDGVVTLSEFPRLAKSDRPKARKLKAVITRADRDGDGGVTRAEFVDGPSRCSTGRTTTMMGGYRARRPRRSAINSRA